MSYTDAETAGIPRSGAYSYVLYSEGTVLYVGTCVSDPVQAVYRTIDQVPWGDEVTSYAWREEPDEGLQAARQSLCVTLNPVYPAFIRVRRPQRCGTNGGYLRHRRRGEIPCQSCRDSHAEYMQRYRE